MYAMRLYDIGTAKRQNFLGVWASYNTSREVMIMQVRDEGPDAFQLWVSPSDEAGAELNYIGFYETRSAARRKAETLVDITHAGIVAGWADPGI